MDNREQLRKWYRNIPNLYHGAFRRKWIKVLQGKSLRAGIDAKCADCMCWQNTEVRLCDIITCPLWQYRPFANKSGTLETEVIAVVTEMGEE